MEPPTHEDPGVGSRPLGVLTLTTAAVCHFHFSVDISITLTQTLIRLNVLTRCMPQVISSPLHNSSTPSSGAQQLRSSWSTLPTTSTSTIGTPSSVHLLHSLRELQRKRPSTMAFLRKWRSVCRLLFLTLPLPFVLVDHSVFNVHLRTLLFTTLTHPSTNVLFFLPRHSLISSLAPARIDHNHRLLHFH